jgi:hypothetical protein
LLNELVREVLQFSPCEPLLLAEARGRFENPEQGLEAVIRQRLVKTQQTEKTQYVL